MQCYITAAYFKIIKIMTPANTYGTPTLTTQFHTRHLGSIPPSPAKLAKIHGRVIHNCVHMVKLRLQFALRNKCHVCIRGRIYP